MERIQEAQSIIDNFQKPKKLPQTAILTHLDDSYTLTDINQFSSKIKPKFNLDWWQATQIGQGISEQIFPDGELRYAVITTQSDYNLSHKNKKYKKNIKKPFWNHNREFIIEGEGIISFPIAYVEDNQYGIEGKIIKEEINTKDVFNTLEKAGLFKQSKDKPKLYHGGVSFDNNNSSVRSSWYTGEGCFLANAGGPSYWSSYGLVALEKTKEKPEIETIRVAKREYDALLKNSRKLKELSNNLESTLNKYR